MHMNGVLKKMWFSKLQELYTLKSMTQNTFVRWYSFTTNFHYYEKYKDPTRTKWCLST